MSAKTGRIDSVAQRVSLRKFALSAASFAFAGLAFTALAGAEDALITPEQRAFFESKVRPVLASNCYKCHSLEQGKSKGGLTLDTREGVMKGGEDGPAVVPGNPEKSSIVSAIRYTDPDLQMPPTDTKRNEPSQKLSAQEIAALTEWVKMGAPDPRTSIGAPAAGKLTGLTDKARSHWAYQPVKPQPAPPVVHPSWCQTPIDKFILSKLELKGMAPAKPASRDALIRRAYYDLAGIPPTPSEIQAFETDQSPHAFATVVDRLLASPSYGERWGRHWLDTARYSDTIGGDRNMRFAMEYRYPYAWSYRDYVINAFNADKPYDQFILEQIAADKLPEAQTDKSRLAALGFLTVGERFQNMNDVINDRIDVVSKGFLASTVTCARCHDHRFDPIPTTDYYALHGIFASTKEPDEKPLIQPGDPSQLADFQQKIATLEQQNRTAYEKLVEETNGEFQNKAQAYLRLAIRRPKNLTSQEVADRIKAIQDGGLELDIIQGLQAAMGKRANNDPAFRPFKRLAGIPEAEFAARAPEAISRILSNAENGGPLNPLVAAALKDAKPDTIADIADIYAKLFLQAAPFAAAYEKAMVQSPVSTSGSSMASGSATPAAAQPPFQIAGLDPNLIPFLNVPLAVEPDAKLTTFELRRLLQEAPRKLRDKLAREGLVFSQINELELTHPGAPARAMTVTDVDRPHDSPVLLRGQAQTPGVIVPRRFFEFLTPGGNPEPFKDGSGRLELARAIASKTNPLTARVMANRIWMHHFGAGIVPTPDDLGNQSEPPSHPELLDYLANYFMENGWSIKKLHRLIMLSSVYMESVVPNGKYDAIDPENRLLSHANIRRLDFEAFRDSLLVFSGRLDHTLGGKPVNLTEEPYSYRRSIYGYIDRGNLPELMSYFDFSDPDMPNSRRSSTIVPQQALFLMNSPMIVGVVRDIMNRPEVLAAGAPVQKLTALYRIVFQRYPTPLEAQLGLQFLNDEMIKEPSSESHQIQPAQIQLQAAAATGAPPVPAPAPKGVAMQQKKNRPGNAFGAIRNEGQYVAKKPLTAWETLTQALLFANEVSYVN